MMYIYEVHPLHRNGRGRFWRANSSGYTDSLLFAGLYAEPSAGHTWASRPLSDFAAEIEATHAASERLLRACRGEDVGAPVEVVRTPDVWRAS